MKADRWLSQALLALMVLAIVRQRRQSHVFQQAGVCRMRAMVATRVAGEQRGRADEKRRAWSRQFDRRQRGVSQVRPSTGLLSREFMSSSFDPLGKSTGGSQPSSAAPSRRLRRALARLPTSPSPGDTVVDEFGLDATPSVDTTPTLDDAGQDDPGRQAARSGRPRRSIISLSLVAFLAWVGLGADGLSSSCYGPAEAFAMLSPKGRTFASWPSFWPWRRPCTVFVISACYSHILEEFPSGGGGYLVASKLLGPKVGVVSGCALLVDYALTITTSIAAAGDAIVRAAESRLPRRPFHALVSARWVSNRWPCWR